MPDALYVRFGGADVANRHAHRESSAQTGGRQEDLAALVHQLNEPFVRGVQLGLGQAQGARVPPEADDAQRNGCEPLEIGMRVDPRGEARGEADVLGEKRSQPARAVCPLDHP